MNRIGVSVLSSLIAVTAVAQTSSPAPAAASPVKVAVIDVERLVRESALGKEAFGRLKRMNDTKKEEADKLTKEIREMEQKLADQGQSLAEDKREALQKQYQEKTMAFKRFNEDASRELDQAQQKELAELQRRVLPVITQIGKEKGFTLIFNKFNAGLVFADDAVDATDDVLKRFNAIVVAPPSPKGTPAPPPAASPAPKKN